MMAMCCKSNYQSLLFAVLVLRVDDCRPYTPFKLLSFFSFINTLTVTGSDFDVRFSI